MGSSTELGDRRDAAEEARIELARFLRTKRERLTPAEVGLTGGPRRRATGLRRSEVAVLAGLSTSWYTYLEQGRPVQPSRMVLDCLARVLCMTEDERRYIHTLVHESYGRLDLLAEGVGVDLARDIVATTQDSPLPVYACNDYFDLVAWNPACTTWFCDDWSDLAQDDCNILYWLLVSPTARQVLVDWLDITKQIIARWRLDCSRRAGEERVAAMVDKYCGLSPVFAEHWASQEVMEHRIQVRRFRHPTLGERTLTAVPMISPSLGPHGVIFHVPA